MSNAMRVIPIALATEGRDGKIQARSVLGTFARWRWAMVAVTQGIYCGLPWLSMHGRQAVWFDLQARRFYLFDAVLYPQDLIYLTGLLIASALLLFFVTAMVGRFWCGFACPQTVYTAIFMWIENRLEGSRQNRLRLDASAWTSEKILRRGGKHLAWLAVASWTGLTLVGYFTPIRELLSPAGLDAWAPWTVFWTVFYALATYLHAGLVREKVCLHMCPYGRFQGALMDANTLNVAYDTLRGEPRQNHAQRQASPSTRQGSCIDCTWCVQVCPTGIDIRKGLQAACIACGLCIDACNEVMDKVGQPRGLIRLTSQAALSPSSKPAQAPWRLLWRPRVAVYGVLLGVVSVALAWGFAQRPPLRMNVIRDRTVMARQVAQGEVENVYRLQVMNATEETKHVQIRLSENADFSIHSPTELHLPAAQAATLPVTLRMTAPAAQRHAGKIVPLQFELHEAGAERSAALGVPSTFMVPR